MNLIGRKLLSALGVFALTAGLMAFGVATASASNDYTCVGGSVPGANYHSLTIAGMCSINSGSVNVQRNVVVQPGAGLDSEWVGSSLTVGRDLLIGAHAIVFLGCGGDQACENGSGTVDDIVFHNLVSNGAAAVVIHGGAIDGEVAINGGGNGFACAPLFEGGPPDFTTLEGVGVGGDVTVKDLRTCWAGMNNNLINGTVNWNDNKTGISDGNLIGPNFIGHNLNCFDNNPLPHLSDFAVKIKNTVGGLTRGQCVGLSQPVI